MKRRNFLKFLALTAITPKVAVEVLSKIPAAVPATPAIKASVALSGGKAVTTDMISKKLKEIYTPAIMEWFNQRSMTYDAFMKEGNNGMVHAKKGYYISVQKSG